MPARTGEQFLRGLVDDREIWVGSDKISSPLDHPSLDRSRATRLVDCFLNEELDPRSQSGASRSGFTVRRNEDGSDQILS